MKELIGKANNTYAAGWDGFLFSLETSFIMLSGIEMKEVPVDLSGASGYDWHRWKEFFCSRDCPAVWVAWYGKYGVDLLSKITECASLLESFDKAAFKQAIYTLDEANSSGDREFILCMTADTIEWLYERVKETLINSPPILTNLFRPSCVDKSST